MVLYSCANHNTCGLHAKSSEIIVSDDHTQKQYGKTSQTGTHFHQLFPDHFQTARLFHVSIISSAVSANSTQKPTKFKLSNSPVLRSHSEVTPISISRHDSIRLTKYNAPSKQAQ